MNANTAPNNENKAMFACNENAKSTSSGFAAVDCLQSLIQNGMGLDNALQAIEFRGGEWDQDTTKLRSSTDSASQSLDLPSKNLIDESYADCQSVKLSEANGVALTPLDARFDMLETLESLIRDGVDLERSLAQSKQKVTDLAAHCGVIADESSSIEPPKPEEPKPRTFFSASFLIRWLDAVSPFVGGSVGVIVLNGRRKITESQFIGWDSAPFRVHSDLVAKIASVAVNRSEVLRSSVNVAASQPTLAAEANDENPEGIEDAANGPKASQTMALCVSLNRLSKTLGCNLIAKSISLPNAKGHAVLLMDGNKVDAEKLASLSEDVELTKLMGELDTWYLIRRFQWGIRFVEALEWLCNHPKTIAATVVGLLTLLLLPVPYYPSRQCVVEPESRQYIGSPCAGRIASCEVRPGDHVSQNQLLARLDDEQILRDLVSAEAELERAEKKLDASMAQRMQAEIGLAKMDILRAQAKLDSLRSQQERMEVRANRSGIVIQGDWQKSIGMPVTLGQNLFEIAELSSLTAEVHLTAQDLGQIRVGDKVAIRSDGTGNVSYYGEINRIEPRATVNDEGAFFVADVVINDPGQRLRPGMKASAQIEAGWRSTGWLLFSRPYNWLSNLWVW